MKNLKFIKEPGYMYDLFFIYVLYFNKDYCLTHFINYNKSFEDTDFYNKLILDVEPIPDELMPFFYLKDNKLSFVTQNYYEPFKDEFTTSYNLSFVQSKLSDYDKVIKNLIKFYFMDISEKHLDECMNSIKAIGKLIKDSKYSGDLKSCLYSFFIEPIPVIQKLSYELIAKDFFLSQRYEKNFKKITELQQKINIDQITDKFKQHKTQKVDLDYFNDIYLSICILNKNVVRSNYYDNKAVLVLGIDYADMLDYLINENKLPELDVFGNALSEKNRIEILDLIYRKNEITIRDIEKDLGFTGTNAYYHLSLMIKANIIKTRNQGRTVMYSINNHYFNLICETLGKYSEKKGG